MYTFIFKNGGWWLVVDNIKTLIDFHEKTDSTQYGNAFMYGLEKDKGQHSFYATSAALNAAIENIARAHHLSYVNASALLQNRVFTQQLEYINNGKTLYINQVGGYHIKSDNEVTHSYTHQEKLIWPKMSKRDIEITRFEGGQHYYAKVGTIEVKDINGNIKWNTYDEAYNQALQLLCD